MTVTENLQQEIELGREGKAQGYSMGMPKLESIIDGVTKQTMTVLGGATGSGKSSAVLYLYVYRPLMEHLDDDNFKVFYASLEMNATMLFAKLLSTYIFETYHKELAIKEILSRKRNYILSDEDYEIVKDGLEWLKKVEKKVEIYDKSLNASKLYAILMKNLEKLGTFTETENRKVFKPYNPNLIYVVVIDHIGILRPSAGSTKKGEIDTTISYLITLRNMCGITPVVVQQINRDQSNIERYKAGRMGIQLSDFKESSDTTDGAEIVLAINNPNRDKLNTHRGYDIKQLGDKFRSISVLKSRYGDADVEIGVNFFGKINEWRELPRPEEIYDYAKYENPDYLIENEEDNNNKELTENNFNIVL